MLYKRDKPWPSVSNAHRQTPRYALPILKGEKKPDARFKHIISSVLLQKLLRLIDFGSQEWTTSSIWVVQQHQLAVVLADFLFR